MNNFIKNDDINNFLSYVLSKEKQAYRENPIPSSTERNELLRLYKKKIEELATIIAEREGITNEN